MVEACNEVFAAVSNGLLPTPAKSHYTFNLRDLSKVFQGMLMFDPTKLTVSGSERKYMLCSTSLGFRWATEHTK